MRDESTPNPPESVGDAQDPTADVSAFDEAAYVRAFPDVATAIERGQITSGEQHYRSAGHAEGRLNSKAYLQELESARAATKMAAPQATVDRLVRSCSGSTFIAGWIDDRHDPLVEVLVEAFDEPILTPMHLVRHRRPDVEAVIVDSFRASFGFLAFAEVWREYAPVRRVCPVVLRFRSGAELRLNPPVMEADDISIRNLVLASLQDAEFFIDHIIAISQVLDGGTGNALRSFNTAICKSAASKAVIERFGPRLARPKASIIIALDAGLHSFFLQNCAYALVPDIEAYEFIYVLNRPELADALCREAHSATSIYGLSLTLVLQPADLGTAAASNVAVGIAASDRLLFLSSNVVPHQLDWCHQHEHMLRKYPSERTKLFGAMLHDSGGTVHQAGLGFAVDRHVVKNGQSMELRDFLRVTDQLWRRLTGSTGDARSRPVPAISSDFMSVDRAWFERINGFSEDYLHGQYADVDICLRSLHNGIAAWTHPIFMLRFQDGPRRETSTPGVETQINLRLLMDRWQSLIVPDLLGPTPDHLLLSEAAPAGSLKITLTKEVPRLVRRTAAPQTREVTE
jgi:hypothetical protein